MKEPVRVAVTGAAGQISYSLLFRIASGQMLGDDQPVVLQLLEIPPAMEALSGVVMELDDCAFDLVQDIIATDDPDVAFKDADYALLVGSRPRGPGMERKDLLEANAAIFSVQGKALNDHASRDVRVLVVGNPANTNCLIAQRNAPDLDPRQFTAMTRLDHNRAVTQLAQKTGNHVAAVTGLAIWGNHSATQYQIFSTLLLEMMQRQPWWISNGLTIVLSRRSSNVAQRSLKREVYPALLRRPMLRLNTCVTGSKVPMGLW